VKSLLKTVVKRWVFPEGSVAPVLRGPCRGMKYRVTPESGHSMIVGYELANQRFLASRVRPGITVFDVGANVGQFMMLFSPRVGPTGRVVCFEPYPPAFRLLEENARLNGLTNVVCLRQALAGSGGRLSFTVNPRTASMGKLSAAEPTHEDPSFSKIEVDAVRLDDAADRLGPPDLLKIDVEGGAAAVLAGAEKTLEARKPAVFIELHGPEEQRAVLDLMRRGWAFQDLAGGRVRDFASWTTPLWGEHA
jgi:FkbM family methyltransferase